MTLPFGRNSVACIAVYALIFVWVITAVPARAASSPQGELTLKQAVAAALANNPELAVSAYELQVADARIAQAGLRPNPEVSIEFENFLGTDEVSGMKSLETTLSLSQVIELGAKRNLRSGVARIGGEVTGIARQAQQLDVLAEVTRRFLDVVVAQQSVALSQRAAELSERTLATITVRVQAARTPVAEQSRAAIAAIRAHIEAQQAENVLQSTRRTLAALWGARTVTFSSAHADLFALPAVDSFATLSGKLQENPDFLRFASEVRLRDAELRLEQARTRPNLTVSVGVRRFEATDNAALVAGFSMALPVSDRNQGAIREAAVRREQLRVQSQSVLVRAEAMLFNLYQELRSARMRVETLRLQAVPQAESALAQTLDGYERGRFSYLELSAAQQELLGLHSAAIDAAADYHRQLTEIERLTGESLAESVP